MNPLNLFRNEPATRTVVAGEAVFQEGEPADACTWCSKERSTSSAKDR